MDKRNSDGPDFEFWKSVLTASWSGPEKLDRLGPNKTVYWINAGISAFGMSPYSSLSGIQACILSTVLAMISATHAFLVNTTNAKTDKGEIEEEQFEPDPSSNIEGQDRAIA